MKRIKLKISKEELRRKLNIKDGKDAKSPTKTELTALIKPLIPKPLKGNDGDTPTDVKLVKLIKPLIPASPEPDTPRQVRDKLVSLKDDERLPITAIHGYENVESSLRTAHADIRNNNAFFLKYAGDTVRTHDLSDFLDGSTKTFTLPAGARVLLVISSSFPTLFRPTVDYTTTASSITFTDQIPAAALGAGQSIIILYRQP